MLTFQQHRKNTLSLWVAIVLLVGLLPWVGSVRAAPPQPTPTRAPFAYGVSFLLPNGQVGTMYRGAPEKAEAQVAARPDDLVAEALASINDARQAAGLKPLWPSQALTAAASAHAADLLSSGAFRHRGSDESWPAERAARHGHLAAYLAENLAVGYITAQETVAAWLANNGSRANLLDADLTHVGLAFAHNGPWHNYWVLVLASPPTHQPGRVLVRFQPTLTAAGVQQILAQVGAERLSSIGSTGIERLAVPFGQETAVVAALQQNPAVDFVELDGMVQVAREPDDPGYAGRWWWHVIQAPEAWDVTTGSDAVTIAVIDTGVDLDHPELATKIVAGHDYVNGDDDPDDDHGHGSHVAGIAAAVTDNATGVAGMAWQTRIMPLKVLSSLGSGCESDVAEAIIYAADHGAQVINLSLGSPSFSYTMATATDYAHGQGVFIAAAAGNNGSNMLFYPAANAYVVGVAATTDSDARASLSNYDAHVDVAAPGVGIYSTYPGGYNIMSGTSMATPFVSGLAALIYSLNSDLTPDEVEATITASALDLGAPGRDDEYGWGRINAFQAVSDALYSHKLQGRVRALVSGGLAGVKITVAGDQTFALTTDAEGLFSQAGLPWGAFTVTPTLANLAFTPASQTVVISDSHVTDLTFTAPISRTFGISGMARTTSGEGASNVTVVMESQHLRLMVQTDARGYFEQAGLINGSYLLTPIQSSAVFEPPSRTVVVSQADQDNMDFTLKGFWLYLPVVQRSHSLQPASRGSATIDALRIRRPRVNPGAPEQRRGE